MSAYTNVSRDFPHRGVPAFKLIDNELGRVKELISLSVCRGASRAIHKTVYPVRDTIFSGKMLRPGLVLLSGGAVNKITDKHIRIAAIVEIIHNATLLHDDVIDEGRKRRGVPTINSLLGNESAILLGDFLLSEVFKMCADLQPRVTTIIAAATAQICQGELMQIIQRHNWQLSEAEYIDTITEKTAAFFSSCCELGAILAEASETQLQSLRCFGLNTGIAFQITDDLLDIIGDEGKTGKTLGNDVDKNKLTLAVIHLLGAVDEKEKAAVIEQLSTARESKEVLAEMLSSYGSLEYAHSRAQEFVAKAIASLAGLRESDAKDALIEAAGFVAGRVVIS